MHTLSERRRKKFSLPYIFPNIFKNTKFQQKTSSSLASGTAKLLVNENTIGPNIVTIQNMPEIFLGYVVYVVVATG